ncbi:MAG: peptidylprolyl isomerase [Candidatus Omnitrophica bacterium]|nr:peptidylprolyl isomerase [Candidatus Omnitrophota bacterium]
MLRILRNKKTAKKIWIGLAIIIIPAFALWGFGGASRDRQDTATIGKIFGKNISNLEFKNSIVAVRTMALMRFGDQLSEIEKYLNFEGQARERLILLYEAKIRKLNVKDKEIIDEIQNAPYFQDKNGFNNKIYQEALRYGLRLQPRIFEEQTRQNLTIAKLYKQITQNVKFSDDQIRQEYLNANQELSIYYIASLFSDFSAKIKPTDKEIAAYFEKNKAMFKEPPTKDKPTRIPELAEIKNKVKDALIKEESKKMAENKIKECVEKLKNKEFKQAAKASGLKTSLTAFFKSNGQIENLGAAGIFWNTAKKLKDKELSSILSNEKGYYIIKLGSIKPTDETKFTKEKQEFGQKLLLEKQNEVFAKFTEEFLYNRETGSYFIFF